MHCLSLKDKQPGVNHCPTQIGPYLAYKNRVAERALLLQITHVQVNNQLEKRSKKNRTGMTVMQPLSTQLQTASHRLLVPTARQHGRRPSESL